MRNKMTTCNCKYKIYPPDRFRELCKEFTEKENAIMDWKRGEYSTNDDRLQNFREIAALIGTSMSRVALTYLLKHIQSIKNAVMSDHVSWRWEGEGGEGTKQRIADTRNYLLLLAGCMDEEQDGDRNGIETSPELTARGQN